MKKSIYRNNLVVVLTVLAVMFFVASFSNSKVCNVNAATDENTVTVENVLMKNGASIRLKSAEGEYKDYAGIRFTLYVSESFYSETATITDENGTVLPEVGMYIVPASLTTVSDMQNGTIPENAIHFVAEKYALDDVQTVGITKSLNGVVYDIPVDDYNTPLIATGYIKYGETTVWATNPQTRSIAQVASLALSNGETQADLNTYVGEVITTDNFTLADVKTDMYRTSEPSSDYAVIPENLTAIFTSSDEDVVTVDRTSGALTRVGKGNATITATLGSIVKTSSVVIGEPAIVNVDSQNYTSIEFFDGYNHFREYYPASGSSIVGEYEGNATALPIYATDSGYRFKPTANYSLEELNAIKKDYNFVSLWFAVNGMNNTLVLYEKGFEGKIDAAPNFYSSTNNGVWNKWTIKIDDYISLISGNEYCILFKTHVEPYVAEARILIGDIFFEYVEPKANVLRSDAPSQFIPANSEEIAGFTGEYSGSATKYQMIPYIGGYSIINKYTEDELNAFALKYDTVSMWIAFDGFVEGDYMAFLADGFEGKVDAGVNSYGPSHNRQWFKWSISISDYISLLAANGYASCSAFNAWTDAGKAVNAYYYFGDVVFEKTA